MAAVLGVSAYYHDAAAALVVDGQLVAAVQEERYSRRKNDPSLPVSAMRACLRVGGLDARDLAEVVYYESPYAKLERVLVSTLESFPRSMRQFGRAMASQLGHKLWVLDALSDALGVDRDRVTHRTHHASHAASAYYPSGFEDAAVLTMDGVGEDVCTALWRGQGRTLTPLAAQHYPHSLGLLYAALTAYLGFRVNEGEYKVMGLAALGQPRLRDAFAELVQLASDGSLRLDLRYFAHHHDVALGFGPALERLLGPRRPPGRRWDLSTAEDQHYADVAATLQAVTEEIVIHLVRQAMTLAGSTRVCLAGGVALNAVANARVLAEAGVTDLFVQPAAGDAGGAVGAALLGALERGEPRTGRLYSAALGEPASASEAHTLARAAGLTARVVDDAPAAAAELLARGAVVAWVDGRLELGPPRAGPPLAAGAARADGRARPPQPRHQAARGLPPLRARCARGRRPALVRRRASGHHGLHDLGRPRPRRGAPCAGGRDPRRRHRAPPDGERRPRAHVPRAAARGGAPHGPAGRPQHLAERARHAHRGRQLRRAGLLALAPRCRARRGRRPHHQGRRAMKRLRTITALFRHFVRAQRLTLIPLLVVLLLAGVLLVLTTGISYVAPFLYALF
jgi:carbamoyltransferase